MSTKYKPGEIVPKSGIYSEFTSYGTKVTEVTCVKEERFPPAESSGNYYELKVAAIHKPSRG